MLNLRLGLATALTAALLCIGAPIVHAQARNQVEVQKQLSGLDAKFGTIYSLKGGFNFQVLDARYTLEPINAYMTGSIPGPKEKLIIFDIAIKNATSSRNSMAIGNMGIQVVDDKQVNYGLDAIAQVSQKNHEFNSSLNPGQGVGQKGLNDPVRLSFRVPVDAVITKLMIGVGRLNTNEKVLRYNLIPYSKATATNKNFAAPFPAGTRDASDPYGAVIPLISKTKIGEAVPSQAFHITIDDVSSPDGATFNGKLADAGKKFVIATITIKNVLVNGHSIFDLLAGDSHNYYLKDADGDPYPYWDVRKKSTDEPIPDRKFEENETYTFRMFFLVPAALKPTQLFFGSFGHEWSVDLPTS